MNETIGTTDVGASLETVVIPKAEQQAPAPVSKEMQDLLDQQAALSKQIAEAQRKEAVVGHFLATDGQRHATDLELDDALLRAAGGLMEHRLAEARAAGKAGWLDSDADLAALAKQQIDAGQLLDGAIYALMALMRDSFKTTHAA